jgi:hypothetical protein
MIMSDGVIVASHIARNTRVINMPVKSFAKAVKMVTIPQPKTQVDSHLAAGSL